MAYKLCLIMNKIQSQGVERVVVVCMNTPPQTHYAFSDP
jgi:hypothetical protein